MKLVVFGLTVSSSWGNGHATLWRGLCRALGDAGHEVVFFERDVPWYASHRDLTELPGGGKLRLYGGWEEVHDDAAGELRSADAAMVTSYCPDARAACDLVLASRAVRSFYDLDTPVTLDALENGIEVPYLPAAGLGSFDVVLSYTGGSALDALRSTLGARRVAPLYGSVDETVHRPVVPSDEYRADLSYLGTYAADRQEALEALFVEPARRLREKRFVLGGSLYPPDFPWQPNIWYLRHVAPPDHPRFYSSSAATLNVTRAAMARRGWCPSGRLFEAAACGIPVVSDGWEGLDRFFTPGREILVASSPGEAVEALSSPRALAEIGRAARARVLSEHTATRRAAEMLDILAGARTEES